MVLSEAVRDFGEYSRCELGHTTATYYSYISWLHNFAAWLEEQGQPDPPVQEITASLIRRFSYALNAKGLRPRTIRGALHALRALFAYLTEQGAISVNPALEVRLPKKDAAVRLTVSDEDLTKLLEASERQLSEFRSLRDKAVLSVLIFCGLRRQELLDLDIHSVNLADDCLIVQQGKGKKSRAIYLCKEAKEALREWLAFRKQVKCSHDALFIALDKRRFGESTLVRMVEEVKAIAGMKGDPRIKPHSIRHAAATRLMRNGADIKSIQTYLGHSHIQTTATYLHTDEEQVRKIAPLTGLQSVGTERQPGGRPRNGAPYSWRRRSSQQSH
jgi:site-specific recombinase XerD